MILAALLAFAALLFYLATLVPGMDWGEGARSQLRAYLSQTDSGFEGHPVYVYLGHLCSMLPWGDPAWRINFSSALCGGLAIFFFFLTGIEIRTAVAQSSDRPECGGGTTPWSALLAAAAMAASHLFWFCSTHPRPLSLNMVCLSVALFLAIRWMRNLQAALLYPLSLVLGLSAGVHLYTALLAPLFLLALTWRARQARFRFSKNMILAIGTCFLAGLSPYLLVFFRDLSRLKQPLVLAALALGAPLSGPPVRASISAALPMGIEWAGALASNLFPWGIAAGLVGMFVLRRQGPLFLLLASCLAADTVLSLSLFAGDPEQTRFQPAFLLFGLFTVVGWESLLEKWPKLARPGLIALLGIPLLAYRTLPASGSDILRLEPKRVQSRYNPNGRGDDSAHQFGRQIMNSLPLGATLLAPAEDRSIHAIVAFIQQVERERLDLKVDSMRGHGDRSGLLRLAQLHPEMRPLYLVLPAGRDTAGCEADPVQAPDALRGLGLARLDCPMQSPTESPLAEEDSLWIGNLTLMDSPMRLQLIRQDSLWFAHLRLDDWRFYPREARVDRLEVRPGAISFSYAGILFSARVVGGSMIGEWRIPSKLEWHGDWELRKQ